jgi:hypothetical protein
MYHLANDDGQLKFNVQSQTLAESDYGSCRRVLV